MPLSDLKGKYQPETVTARSPLPPLPAGVRIIVAFDQALDSTGVVTYDGTDVTAWTLRSDPETKSLTGHARTLARSVDLQDHLMGTIDSLIADHRHVRVLYETPATARGQMRRTESSLMGAHCVEWACHIMMEDPDSGCFSVSAQKAKSVVAGNPRADKAEVREAIKATYLPEQTDPCTNDHERDALALIVTHLKAKK